jgi:hypothetical protein
MLTSPDAQQLPTLSRISNELDIVGDVTATVDSPSALLGLAYALTLEAGASNPGPIIRVITPGPVVPPTTDSRDGS